jgi:hypothetical protein
MGLLWVSVVVGAFCVYWVLWVFDGIVLLFLGSGFVRALLYTAYVRRGALCFLNKIALYLSKKERIYCRNFIICFY